jgi:hypothetical protein
VAWEVSTREWDREVEIAYRAASAALSLRDQDPLQLKETGEELVLYTHGYFHNFTWCEIIEIAMCINDRLLSSWKLTGEDPDASLRGWENERGVKKKMRKRNKIKTKGKRWNPMPIPTKTTLFG